MEDQEVCNALWEWDSVYTRL